MRKQRWRTGPGTNTVWGTPSSQMEPSKKNILVSNRLNKDERKRECAKGIQVTLILLT